MSTYRLVAVLLLTILGNPAAAAEFSELQAKNARTVFVVPSAAAETPKHQSNNAHKLLTLLGTIGVDNRDVRNFVSTVDTHIDHGYLKFSEHQLPGNSGKITLRYRLSGTVDPLLFGSNKHGIRRLELSYKPSDDSRWEAVATRKYVVVNYHIPLDKIDW